MRFPSLAELDSESLTDGAGISSIELTLASLLRRVLKNLMYNLSVLEYLRVVTRYGMLLGTFYVTMHQKDTFYTAVKMTTTMTTSMKMIRIREVKTDCLTAGVL